MRFTLTQERAIAGMVALLILVTVAMGLRAAYHHGRIDLDKSHTVVFEASRQLADFDRLRYAAMRVQLNDPALEPDAFQRAFTLTTSRMRNFRNGEVTLVEDPAFRFQLTDLIERYDVMMEIMARPGCDDLCRATAIGPRIRPAQRVLMKMQGRGLVADATMRAQLQALYKAAVNRIFGIAFVLIGIAIAIAIYMTRKNTILRQQTDRLKQNQHRIAEVSEYRARFLAGMSHEFRTPLNAIKGFTQMMMLMGDTLSKEKVGEYLSDIEKSAIDLEHLTDTVLDLAKIDAGAVTLHETQFDLAETLREIQGQFMIGNAIPVQRLALDLPLSLMIRGDEAALKRCAQNLISNALKFSQAETRVDVSLRPDTNGGVALSVQDRGCGIPCEEVNSVWGVYARSSYTRVSDMQGTGLGLPIVRALAEAHGGDATLHSQVGEGTTATLTLPRTRIMPNARAVRAA